MTSAPPRSPGTRSGTAGIGSTVGNRSTPRRPPAKRRRNSGRRTAARRVAGSRRPAAKRRRPRRRSRIAGLRQWWPALLVAAAVLVGVAWDSETTGIPPVPGRCAVPGSGLTLSSEQAANAATIADVAHERGLPDRAVVIALATAQQESGLRNLNYGDRDSLGLFQQRPSQGWGSPAQVRDPVHAAGKFYDHLVQVPGWQTGRLTAVAQTVQRSAFPEAYARWEGMATELTTALKGSRLGRLTCT
jgi:hypothetical protein